MTFLRSAGCSAPSPWCSWPLAVRAFGSSRGRCGGFPVRAGSTDVLPPPGICLSALRIQREAQDLMRARLAEQRGTWPDDGLVFTTRTGRPIEPRAVKRRFDCSVH